MSRDADLSEPGAMQARQVVEFMFERREPYSALGLDRDWNIVMTNQTFRRSVEKLIDPTVAYEGEPPNELRMVFHPDGLWRNMVNPEQVTRTMVARVHRAAALYREPAGSATLLADLLNRAGGPADWRTPAGQRASIVAPWYLQIGDRTVRLFSAITTRGARRTSSWKNCESNRSIPRTR